MYSLHSIGRACVQCTYCSWVRLLALPQGDIRGDGGGFRHGWFSPRVDHSHRVNDTWQREIERDQRTAARALWLEESCDCQGTFGDASRLFLCGLLRFVFAVALVDLSYRGKLRLALIQSVIRALESRDLTCLHIIYSTHTPYDSVKVYDHGLHINMGMRIKNTLSLTKDEVQTYTRLLMYWMFDGMLKMGKCTNERLIN